MPINQIQGQPTNRLAKNTYKYKLSSWLKSAPVEPYSTIQVCFNLQAKITRILVARPADTNNAACCEANHLLPMLDRVLIQKSRTSTAMTASLISQQR
jgi:hypothetical protein